MKKKKQNKKTRNSIKKKIIIKKQTITKKTLYKRKRKTPSEQAKDYIKRQTIKFILTSTTILFADLLINVINKEIFEFSASYSKYLITFIGMFIILFLFYSVFINIDDVSKFVINKTVKLGKHYVGKKIGFYIITSTLYTLLFAGYYWIWFNQNLFLNIYNDILKSSPKNFMF